jgi:hypothetical protein
MATKVGISFFQEGDARLLRLRSAQAPTGMTAKKTAA